MRSGEKGKGDHVVHIILRRHWNSSHTLYYTISMQAFSPDGPETV